MFSLRIALAALALAFSFAAHAEDRIIVRNVIAFDPDSVAMGVVAKEIIKDVTHELIKAERYKRVVVIGYCDTADKAPTLLSRYRAKAVADHMLASGLPSWIKLEYRGDGTNNQRVKTGPGIREPYNRRVTISY
jgi:outer membrane protein OmpA-like peptidoglycan-associated protein